MDESTVPFLSSISTFSNTGVYERELKRDLLRLVPALEEYINVKLNLEELVWKSFISHLTRLLERIYDNKLIQGEPQRMNTEVRYAFHLHHKAIQTIFNHVISDKKLELTLIEMYFLVLYFLRLKTESS
ncbi:hypothetical protein [Niallia oryzisoli]|uniref:hypothetical protein n=1 Tax=Niallia oryzisoli TaxID=1737571 RepID=UPI003734C797